MPNKRGHNKGISRKKKALKHQEAEARNALTPVERTRAHRRQMGAK